MAERWFKNTGAGHGDRTVAEQMTGLGDAVAVAKGKTVLDVGCAEGLISREFARAGAQSVHGIEIIPRHVEIAEDLCRGLACTFQVMNLNDWDGTGIEPRDVVLALAVLHKMRDPAATAALVAKVTRHLLVIRLPLGSQGVIFGKMSGARCNLNLLLPQHGLKIDKVVTGPRKELVQYWRRPGGAG